MAIWKEHACSNWQSHMNGQYQTRVVVYRDTQYDSGGVIPDSSDYAFDYQIKNAKFKEKRYQHVWACTTYIPGVYSGLSEFMWPNITSAYTYLEKDKAYFMCATITSLRNDGKSYSGRMDVNCAETTPWTTYVDFKFNAAQRAVYPANPTNIKLNVSDNMRGGVSITLNHGSANNYLQIKVRIKKPGKDWEEHTSGKLYGTTIQYAINDLIPGMYVDYYVRAGSVTGHTTDWLYAGCATTEATPKVLHSDGRWHDSIPYVKNNNGSWQMAIDSKHYKDGAWRRAQCDTWPG